MNEDMPIEMFMTEWRLYEPRAMRNMALIERFFANRFEALDTTETGYAQAFVALRKSIQWKGLEDYEPALCSDIFITTARYAFAAGNTPSPSTSCVAQWRVCTKKATVDFNAWDRMRTLMRDMLGSSLPAQAKLHVCRLAHPDLWLTFAQKELLCALLPANETDRFNQLPWAFDQSLDNKKALVRAFCPTLSPLLDALVPPELWTNRPQLVAFVAKASSKNQECLDLPTGMQP